MIFKNLSNIWKILLLLLVVTLIFTTPVSAAGGSGTASSPYLVSNAAELQSMSNGLSSYYKLTGDIDMSGYAWTPVGIFLGQLDGDGHSIKNLTYTSTANNVGLFSQLGAGAVVKNVTFDNCKITSTHQNTAIVAGYISGTSGNPVKITNVHLLNCTATGSRYYHGGFVGYLYSSGYVELTDCSIQGCTITTSSNHCGGLIGCVNSSSKMTAVRCEVNDSKIASTSSDYCGGLIGYVGSSFGSNGAVITDCRVNDCTITTSSNRCGGLIGFVISSSVTVNGSDVNRCKIASTSSNDCGGLIGYVNSSSVNGRQNSVNDCVISTSSDSCGGLIGNVNSSSSGELSECDVIDCVIDCGSYGGGGLVGFYRGTSTLKFTNCDVDKCTIEASNANGGAGGLMGCVCDANNGGFSGCIVSNSTVINTSGYAGGLLGTAYYSSYTGTVTFTNCKVTTVNVYGTSGSGYYVGATGSGTANTTNCSYSGYTSTSGRYLYYTNTTLPYTQDQTMPPSTVTYSWNSTQQGSIAIEDTSDSLGTYVGQWTYGDGQTSYGNENLTHVYQNSGTYVTTVKVSNKYNTTGYTLSTGNILVLDPSPPEQVIVQVSPTKLVIGEVINFTAVDPVSHATYTWQSFINGQWVDLGTGTTLTYVTNSSTFSSSGVYKMRCVASTSVGSTNSEEVEITLISTEYVIDYAVKI